MQIVKERNPYLKRILSDTPHKYSHDIHTGKYFLITPNGKEQPVNKTGTFPNKFRNHFTGSHNHKHRYQQAKIDSSALHFVPDLSFNEKNGYHCPMPDKFAGYAQYPYKISEFPKHLKAPGITPRYPLRKSKSERDRSSVSQYQEKAKSKSIILENSSSTFINEATDDHFFQTSFYNMTNTKPLPTQRKKTCYNYKCKFLKQFVFDEKGKTQASTRFSLTKTRLDNTQGRSFHQKMIKMENQEASLISNME